VPDSIRATIDVALGTQYTIQRLLGRGGMGAVYLAVERSLERLVAIKVLAPDVAGASAYRERFRREARVAARLSHPNIVPLYAFGEARGLCYYVMGYVRGESLAERLKREGPLPCEAVRRILAELGDALDCAHRHGVVHRDIKPANILLDDESGRALLADFGVARSHDTLDRLSASGIAVGTPHYMSPEQALGSAELDGRSDIYSLGVLAYVMLTGHEPFTGENAQQVAYAHVTREPPPLLDAAPDTPAELAATVERCLAKDPADRWPDGRCLRRSLGYDESAETAPPSELRDLPSFGTLATVWALVWAAVGVFGARTAAQRWACALLAVLIPFGLALDVLAIRRPGLRLRDVARVAFWPPTWWGLWWPSALRRRGDLWTRLPWIARWTRTTITVAVVVAPTLLILSIAGPPEPLADALAPHPWWLVAAEGALLAMLLAAFAGVVAWGRRRGLSLVDMVRLVHGPTIVSPSWSAAPIAGLLAPPHGAPRSAPPTTPQALLRAVLETAGSRTGEAATRSQEAASGARQLVEAIERLDAEIAALAAHADAGEVARLEARLAAVEQSAPGAGEREEIRRLLVAELELVRRLGARRDAVVARRAHLVELLQRLWLLLEEMGDPTTAADAERDRRRERLRALVAHANEQADDVADPAQSEEPSPQP
jgi:hypothetical protein